MTIPDWLLAIPPALIEGLKVAALEWSHQKHVRNRRRHYETDYADTHAVPSEGR